MWVWCAWGYLLWGDVHVWVTTLGVGVGVGVSVHNHRSLVSTDGDETTLPGAPCIHHPKHRRRSLGETST